MAFERLTTEINRIVAAPYPVSLKGLYNIVSSEDCTPYVLRTWAESKPCQIAPLSSAVVETLRQWPYATKLLASFASIETFRDDVLHAHPATLKDLIEEALTSLTSQERDKGRQEYVGACVAMLSTPLPDSFIIPAQLPSLVLALIESMVRQPTSETITPLYRIITGIRGSILDILPGDSMSRFQSECTRILRKLDDHVSSLLCLAMFARIASAETRPSAQRPVWLRSICQFFDATRGLKTLDLVFLRVILACSSTTELSPSQSIDCILLAKEICDAVEPSQKTSWIQSGKAKILKLCEKILKADHDIRIQMLGIVFLASLLPTEMIPGEIVKLAQRRLLSDDGRKAVLTMSPDLVSLLIEKLLARFNEAEVTHHIQLILPGRNVNISEALLGEYLLSGVLSACQKSNAVKSKVTASLSEASNWIPIGSPQICKDHEECCTAEFCPVALSLSKNILTFELAALYVDALLSSPVPTSRAETISPYLLKLIDYLKLSIVESHPFPSSSTLMKPTLQRLLPDSRNIPGGGRDWRSALFQALTDQAGQSYETIISRMGVVCHDLELRCGNVEEPLRELTTSLDELTAEHEKTKNHCEALQQKDVQSAQLISELRVEKDWLRQRVEALNSQLTSAQDDVQSTRRDAEAAIHETENTARDAELEYSATIAAKDDAIDELQIQLESLEADQELLKEQVETSSTEKSEALAVIVTLRDEVKTQHEIIESKDQQFLEQETMINELQDEHRSLRSTITEHQSMLSEKAMELENVKNEHENENEQHAEEMQNVKQIHAEEVSAIQANLYQIEDTRKEVVHKLEISLQTTKSKATKALASRDRKIGDLKKQVEDLERERAEKAREFAKAQEYSNRLMTVFKTDRLPSRTPSAADRSWDKPTPSSRSVKPRQQRRETEPNTQDKLLADVSFSSFGSVSCNVGPSPKRRRSTHRARIGTPAHDLNSNSPRGEERSSPLRNSSGYCLTPVSREPLSDIGPGTSNFIKRNSGLSFLSTPESEVGRCFRKEDAGCLDENEFSRLDFTEDTFLSTDTL